jgi:acid phosphatase type 7
VSRTALVAAILALVALLVVYGAYARLGAVDDSRPSPDASRTSPASRDVSTAAPGADVLVGAGDIADCSTPDDEATAAIVESIRGTVFTLGDNAYENGTADEFARCYGPSWGRPSIRDRTRPTAGNHEYGTANARGYFDYFGQAAGSRGEGWYAYDLGEWRVYALNSNCDHVGGCGPGSAQEGWLRADLASNPRSCVVGMWHHARFSSGEHGNDDATEALWRALHEAGAELVLVGHDHDYERFAPQAPNGELDDQRGIVQIVAGTGGRKLRAFRTIRANSLVRNSDTFGVLRLSLSAGTWSSEFVPVAGQAFRDSASGTCR